MEKDANNNKAVRTFQQKLSDDVVVEVSFYPTTTTTTTTRMDDSSIALIQGDNNDGNNSQEVGTLLLSDRTTNIVGRTGDGSDDDAVVGETEGSSSIFHIDISNFTGRLTFRQITTTNMRDRGERGEVGGGTLDGRSLGEVPQLPSLSRLSVSDAETLAVPLTIPMINNVEAEETSMELVSNAASDVSHVTTTGPVDHETGHESNGVIRQRPNSSTSKFNRSGLMATTQIRESGTSRRLMLHRLRNRTSMRNLANLPGLTDGRDLLQTELHELVSSFDLTVRRMEEVIAKDPEAVKETDSRGRLPLHLLGANSDLANNPDGQAIARQCAIILMELFPDSIVQMDKEGMMPFVFLIYKWVELAHTQDNAQSNRDAPARGIASAIGGKVIQLVQMGSGNKENDTRAGTDTQSSSLTESSNRFPPVLIFEEVEWCFDMLSLAMDHLGGKPLEYMQNMRPTLSYRKQRKDRQALAENLATIPQVLKTALLLESNTIRNKIMDSSVVRRALFCPQSVGPWLTSMLRYKEGSSSETVVQFLLKLSQLSVEDYVGDYRKPLPQDETLFDTAKVEVYRAVEKLRDIVPSLLILNDALMDNALATPVIWFVMNREIIKPFNVGISTTDFQLLLTTIIAVRQATFGNTGDPANSEVFPFLRILNVVFLACLYSLLRRICEAYALYRISSKVAYRYCVNGWHVIDTIGVGCALWASGHYGRLMEEGKDSHIEPVFGALIVGLLWIRVLSYLKGVNEHLATFILALIRIFVDIRFFCVVLLIVVLMFGDMFDLIFLKDQSIDCESESYDNPAAADFCNASSPLSSYLRVYAIIIGDFNLNDFQLDSTITVMWFLVTFIGLVVMLNTLIAVITTSYDRSEKTSIILFRRARSEIVASNAALEGFLSPRIFTGSREECKPNLGIVLSSFARWAIIMTFLVSEVYSSLYLLQRLITAIYEARVWTIIAMLFLCLVMAYTFWAAFVVFSGWMLRLCCGESTRVTPLVEAANKYFVEKAAALMFGVDPTDTKGGDVIRLDDDDGTDTVLHERMDKMEKMLERILELNVATDMDTIDHNSTSILSDK